jgi:hypothetical protein
MLDALITLKFTEVDDFDLYGNKKPQARKKMNKVLPPHTHTTPPPSVVTNYLIER